MIMQIIYALTLICVIDIIYVYLRLVRVLNSTLTELRIKKTNYYQKFENTRLGIHKTLFFKFKEQTTGSKCSNMTTPKKMIIRCTHHTISVVWHWFTVVFISVISTESTRAAVVRKR
jgi:hypothetical protein